MSSISFDIGTYRYAVDTFDGIEANIWQFCLTVQPKSEDIEVE